MFRNGPFRYKVLHKKPFFPRSKAFSKHRENLLCVNFDISFKRILPQAGGRPPGGHYLCCLTVN